MQKFSSSAWKSHQKAQSEMNNRCALLFVVMPCSAFAFASSLCLADPSYHHLWHFFFFVFLVSTTGNRAAAMLGALRRKAEAVNASRKAAQHTKAPRLRTQTYITTTTTHVSSHSQQHHHHHILHVEQAEMGRDCCQELQC